MAKKKTGIGFEGLFKESPADKAGDIVEARQARAPRAGFGFEPKTIERLEAAENFASWLVGQDVGQQMIVEAALKIALQDLDARGKESRLIGEIESMLADDSKS